MLGRKTFRSLIAAGAAVVLAACANSGTGAGNRGGSSMDWNHVPHAIEVATGPQGSAASGAAQYLPFAPVEPPSSLGDPMGVYVADPQILNKADRDLTLIFQHPEYGRFWVNERRTQWDEAGLEAFPAQHANDPGSTEKDSLSSLPNGNKALITEASEFVQVKWLMGPLLITAFGPAPSFTTDDAAAIASAFVKNGTG